MYSALIGFQHPRAAEISNVENPKVSKGDENQTFPRGETSRPNLTGETRRVIKFDENSARNGARVSPDYSSYFRARGKVGAECRYNITCTARIARRLNAINGRMVCEALSRNLDGSPHWHFRQSLSLKTRQSCNPWKIELHGSQQERARARARTRAFPPRRNKNAKKARTSVARLELSQRLFPRVTRNNLDLRARE